MIKSLSKIWYIKQYPVMSKIIVHESNKTKRKIFEMENCVLPDNENGHISCINW